jgi:hypothetical protein
MTDAWKSVCLCVCYYEHTCINAAAAGSAYCIDPSSDLGMNLILEIKKKD